MADSQLPHDVKVLAYESYVGQTVSLTFHGICQLPANLTPENGQSVPVSVSLVLCRSANSGMVLGKTKLQTTAAVSELLNLENIESRKDVLKS